MIRSVLALVSLVLLALLGAWSALGMYDLAAIYSDPTDPPFLILGGFGGVVAFAVALMAGVAGVAVVLARGRLRRFVRASAAALVAAAVIGIVVGNHVGAAAKRVESAVPPHCGIANPGLNQEFRAIDHPGYFGGGTSGRAGCSFMLTAPDLASALERYDDRLVTMGYQVSRDPGALTASRPGFRFTVRSRVPADGEGYLTVGLREAG
jgi:hypothetical protein